MAPAKPGCVFLLLFICSFSTDAAAMLNTTAPCLPDQASSLLRLKGSFIGTNNNLSSWRAGSDCCQWEGIICGTGSGSGRVISLDLGGLFLSSDRLHPALFNLTSLRNLSLASNCFNGVRLPASGFERLRDITHLNFSNTQISGQIPIGISRLKSLVTLDFSGNWLYLQEPSFQTFMANMSNLRELRLDNVNLSSSGSTWSTVLADYVPQLRILSLYGCSLSGSIHPSLSRLHSLVSINIGSNELSGKVPEYFSELSSLSSLDISGNQFEGQFPTEIFRLKSLMMLDLSYNPMLLVRLTCFPKGNSLQYLNLEGTNFTYDTPLAFANLTSLQTLRLTTATMAKEFPTSIRLPSLNQLKLIGSGLEKPELLYWVGSLVELKYLKLDSYYFSQSVPTWIGNLTRLETLQLWLCDFSVPIPHQIAYLTTLNILYLELSDFYGQQIPPWIGNLTKLTDLNIISCNFSGPIPSTIADLTQLEKLQFRYNSLTGNIPKSLFTLPALQAVYLDRGSQLSGSLEDIPTPSSSPLTYIHLSGNLLTGPIPKSFFQLANLKELNLESNKLTGTLELRSIWGLKNLVSLSLSNNMISLIDKEGDTVFPSLLDITNIALVSCNLTKFPAAFRYIGTVSNLNLSNNQMKGAIPSWVWRNWKYKLITLDLSHNMFTNLEKSPSFVHMPSLTLLDLSSNRLQGRIPIPVSLSEEVTLNYSNNNFSSIMPNFGGYLTNGIYINFSNNKLSGLIPPSVCSLNKLDTLDLSYNYFSGPVPACLIKKSPIVLKLRKNKLHGVLPKNITEGCKLESIDLSGNLIEGTLPTSLKHCNALELLDVGNNRIVGSFPSWMGALPNLRVLILRSNQLNGTITDLHTGHKTNKHFTSLQIIDLASNNFSGYLHSEWFETLKSMMNNNNDKGQILERNNEPYEPKYQYTVTITYKNSETQITKILTTFEVIDVSDNSFDGPVPELLSKLVSLHGLNMSHNNFVGQIPPQLGDLTRLESLDLCCNNFSGEIPQELTSLTSLSCLNLSYNNLTGRIPEQNQFLSFPSSSFEGNAGLCGKQVPKQCDNHHSTTPRALDHQEPNSLWQDRVDAILLFTFVGLGFGVGFALAILSHIFF